MLEPSLPTLVRAELCNSFSWTFWVDNNDDDYDDNNKFNNNNNNNDNNKKKDLQDNDHKNHHKDYHKDDQQNTCKFLLLLNLLQNFGGYWCYYLHTWRGFVVSVCGIFFYVSVSMTHIGVEH